MIGLPVALVGEVANIMRWQILMRVQGMYMSWRRAVVLFFVGLFFNLFMPGYTGGDFARLFYLMKEFPSQKKEAILTIVMDRLIGMLSLVVTAGITTVLRWNWLQRTPQASFLLWILLFMVGGFILVTSASFAITGLRLLSRLPEHFPFRERLVETSEAYHLFARDKSRSCSPSSFLFLSSFRFMAHSTAPPGRWAPLSRCLTSVRSCRSSRLLFPSPSPRAALDFGKVFSRFFSRIFAGFRMKLAF